MTKKKKKRKKGGLRIELHNGKLGWWDPIRVMK